MSCQPIQPPQAKKIAGEDREGGHDDEDPDESTLELAANGLELTRRRNISSCC